MTALLLLAITTVTPDPPGPRPDATVDLATREGAALVKAQWRYSNVRLVEVDGRAPGADLKPSGDPLRTLDYEPKVGDEGGEAVDPTTLDKRRGSGRISFAWYKTSVTLPARVGATDIAGATVSFEIVVDDYAEIWVDGKLPAVLGQRAGAVVGGFNTPNRVILTRNAHAGQKFQIAVFGMNGPVSASPQNFIWVKSATLDVYKPRPADAKSWGTIERRDPALDAVVPPGAKIEKLADGFLFTEGPVWHPDGYLLFSDPNANVIYRWTPDGALSVYRTHSGYAGTDIGEYGQPGSNGLTLDREGRLTIDEHGRHRVVRLEHNGQITVLADNYQGKRLNSPNDLVYRSDGALYFTDPPFGLPKFFDDPRKQLPFSGVFCVIGGELKLVSTDLKGPNGIAFSPDEKWLYVSNWDEKRKVILRYAVHKDGSLSDGNVFFDMAGAPGEEALDGLKVDQKGNVYASGPGGLWIISAAGKHLGTLHVAELPANFAWGDTDGRTLYMTARTGLYRIRLNIARAGALPRNQTTSRP